jgi:hypothetical protein
MSGPACEGLALARRGAWASCKASFSMARRALLAMWFLALGIFPYR